MQKKYQLRIEVQLRAHLKLDFRQPWSQAVKQSLVILKSLVKLLPAGLSPFLCTAVRRRNGNAEREEKSSPEIFVWFSELLSLAPLVPLKFFRLIVLSNLLMSLSFDLTDTLTGDTKLFTYFFESSHYSIFKAMTHLKNSLLLDS